MTFFTASIETIIIRFYLMMGVVIASFFLGIPWMAALALPMFLTIIAGVTFFPDRQKSKANIKSIGGGRAKTAA